MANIAAIRSVSSSLESYLNNAYSQSKFPKNVTKPACTFVLKTIGGLKTTSVTVSDTTATVVIFLYRVSMNQHLRNAGRTRTPDMRPIPMSIDLHYLFSFWANSADNEQLILAWTLRQLHEYPLLDSSVLSREASWEAEDIVHLIPEEISNEDLMRIWDTLEPDYRLSLSYIARVVRIDPDEVTEGQPVVATSFRYAQPDSEA